MTAGSLILVRHTEVCATWKGYCYGASDVPLSAAGLDAIPALATTLTSTLADQRPVYVCHSGLARTRALATAIADRCASRIVVDDRFAELNFGAWEGRAWDDIYLEFGDAMADIIHAPARFAPPDGETVCALRQRVVSAIAELPRDGLGIIVSHGGPLSAIRGTLAGNAASDWPGLVPAYGEHIVLDFGQRRQLAACLASGFAEAARPPPRAARRNS